jgi:hypothetical protein
MNAHAAGRKLFSTRHWRAADNQDAEKRRRGNER